MKQTVVDIVVVGSGAGAMTAALRAAHAGAEVLIVEKGEKYGGTSATSGGGLWIPCNHLMPDVGIEDSRDKALNYLRELTGDAVTLDWYLIFLVAHGPSLSRMCRYLPVPSMEMPSSAPETRMMNRCVGSAETWTSRSLPDRLR